MPPPPMWRAYLAAIAFSATAFGQPSARGADEVAVPPVLMLEMDEASEPYLAWIDENVTG